MFQVLENQIYYPELSETLKIVDGAHLGLDLLIVQGLKSKC